MIAEKIRIFISNIQLITLMEVMFVVLCFVLGIFFGKLFSKAIKGISRETIFINFIKSIVGLVVPLLVVSLLFLNLLALPQINIKPVLTILCIKIAIAWFAIMFIKLLMARHTTGWFIAIVIVPITILNLFGLWSPFAAYLNGIIFEIGKLKISLYQLLKTSFIVITLFRFTKFITKIGEQRLRKLRQLKVSDKILIIKVIQVITYFVILLIALDLLGIDITALAVFSGALGVGLGFGLQKVTSNFISGIIILLEKSIEVDDLVELNDGTYGIIKRTGARYMLIETSQGKEVLVPNEDFITQRVTNWTYTSHKCRVEIPVNVAYNTDLELAKNVILEAIRSCSKVIKTPEPLCYLKEFGANSINFLALFWIEDVIKGKYEPQNEVLFAIWKSFKKNNIEMPYPQMDVHIKNK